MLITKVKRSYSRSINAKNYNVPESWIRVEAEYEATIESGDDPTKVSEMIYEQAKAEVVANINEITSKMKEVGQSLQQVASTGAPAPVAPGGTAVPAVPRSL